MGKLKFDDITVQQTVVFDENGRVFISKALHDFLNTIDEYGIVTTVYKLLHDIRVNFDDSGRDAAINDMLYSYMMGVSKNSIRAFMLKNGHFPETLPPETLFQENGARIPTQMNRFLKVWAIFLAFCVDMQIEDAQGRVIKSKRPQPSEFMKEEGITF